MSKPDEPNVVLPLASSYNERFTTGKTSVLTTGLDQRKINCYYELAQNPITGKSTVYLTKRPGCQIATVGAGLTGLAADQSPTLAIAGSSGPSVSPWIFGYDSGSSSIIASGGAASAVVTSDGSRPKYVDKTVISGTQYVVLQVYKVATGAWRTFYASSAGSWTEISDSDFTSLGHMGKMEHLDGFAYIMSADNYINNSDVNSLSSWTAGNRIKKQIEQDAPVGLMKCGPILLAFGLETVEGFVNAGNPSGSPLKRITLSDTRIGLESVYYNFPTLNARHYYATLGGKAYFVGRKGGAQDSLGLFVTDGQTFEKVSTTFIDKILSQMDEFTPTSSFNHVGVISFQGKYAIAIALDTVDATTQRWLMFFPDLKEWFEWQSTLVQPINSGSFFVGIKDVSAGNWFQFNGASNSWRDGSSTSYTMTAQFKLPRQGHQRKFMRWAGVMADKATSSNNLSVEFSDDDYASWSSARTIDLSSEKPLTYRCGSYRDRAVRLTHSANSDCRIESFVARVD